MSIQTSGSLCICTHILVYLKTPKLNKTQTMSFCIIITAGTHILNIIIFCSTIEHLDFCVEFMIMFVLIRYNETAVT